MLFPTGYVTNVASLSGFPFFRVSHKDVFEVSVGAAVSPEGSTEGGVTLKMMRSRPEAEVLPEGPLSSLSHWPLQQDGRFQDGSSLPSV